MKKKKISDLDKALATREATAILQANIELLKLCSKNDLKIKNLKKKYHFR